MCQELVGMHQYNPSLNDDAWTYRVRYVARAEPPESSGKGSVSCWPRKPGSSHVWREDVTSLETSVLT